MKLIENVRAYRCVTEMMKESWSFSFIYPLIRLAAELKEDYELFSREEMALVARWGKKEADGTVKVDENGCFTFADEKSREAYYRSRKNLEETERESPPPIESEMPSFIRGEWLAALLPFCSFPEKEGRTTCE